MRVDVQIAIVKTISLLLLIAALTATAHADPAVASAQQALKDQGFYYGEITGSKDADTTAAIRRFQIRNGLRVTGDLNAETQRSLKISGSDAPTPTPAPARSTPAPAQRPTARPEPDEEAEDTDDLRDDSPMEENDPRMPPAQRGEYAPNGYYPRVHELDAERALIFEGTPFEVAPPAVQQRVILGAQVLLARAGLYRSGVDGIYGPGTANAIRIHQSRLGLPPTGRLDMETLASLGLLPGQQAPAFEPRLRRYRRLPAERIYIPR